MQHHLLQSEHNQQFHTAICANNPDIFFDWKITCLFYVAIHYLKALAAKNSIDIGKSHAEIERNVSPLKGGMLMPLPLNAWRWYHNLYRYSRTARYNGIMAPLSFEAIKKIDHKHCVHLLSNFKNFIKSQGVPTS